MDEKTGKIVIVTIPIPLLKPFKGYLLFWSIKSYFSFYFEMVFDCFKTMKVGNISSNLLDIFRSLIYAKDQVDINLKEIRIRAYASYLTLAGIEHSYF